MQISYDQQIITNIKKSVQSQLNDELPKERSFVLSHYCVQNQSHCVASFLSIKNLKNEHVAYLVSIERDQTLHRVEDKFIFQFIALTVIFLALPIIGYLFFVIKQRKEFQLKSQTDFLTGALNRHGCQSRLKNLLIARKNNSKNIFAVLMFDIDHFKKINDTYGHDIGDLILKELVVLVEQNIREDDAVCRWGGEEFLILLPKASYEKATKVSLKLLSIVREFQFTQIDNLTISIGYTQVIAKDTTDTIIKRADDGLYESKQKGRDTANGKR